ncbi:MAG: TolC family protein [Pseudomonadota bacterium]
MPSSLNLQSLLIHLIENHEEIKSVKHQVEQFQAQYAQSKGLYYPTMNLAANGGEETINKEFVSDTTETRYEVTLRADQLITDFGKTSHTIDRSGILLEQAQVQLESTKQQLMLEGIRAYINIIRARERLKLAHQSEVRIKELTGIEKTLVEKGAGLSSDVLQAKSQLAGAMALRVEAQGELQLAKNRFQAIFYRFLTDEEVEQFEDIQFPSQKLPLELEQAVELALKENPELLITRYTSQIARKDIDIAKTAFYPRLNLFAEALRKENDDGVKGYDNQASAGLELRYNLFNGGSDKQALNSALAAQKAATYHTDYIQRVIREQVSNSWEQLSILKQKNELLDQQADIVQNFLLLAKKERKMGTRSLLDVLNGEINYIHATSTAIAARQDTKTAAFNLLFSMGRIGLELFE